MEESGPSAGGWATTPGAKRSPCSGTGLDRRILQEEGWADLGKGFDSPRYFATFFNTLRWNCATATVRPSSKRPSAPAPRLDAYQTEPLHKALWLPHVNLFIANDTGPGKTTEAGLVARTSALLLMKLSPA